MLKQGLLREGLLREGLLSAGLKKVNAILRIALFSLTAFFAQAIFTQSAMAQGSPIDSVNIAEVLQVNINQADAETIAEVLDGVGIRRAEAIVSYREENGRFNSADELIDVSGIGEVTLMSNMNKILVE